MRSSMQISERVFTTTTSSMTTTSITSNTQLYATKKEEDEEKNVELLKKPSSPSEDKNDTAVSQDSISPTQIVDLIEVSFIQACMQLSKGYVDVLKLFIAATKAAYEANMEVNELRDHLQLLSDDITKSSAGRPLMKEEEELRYSWIVMVFLTLKEMGWEKQKDQLFLNQMMEIDNKEGRPAGGKNDYFVHDDEEFLKNKSGVYQSFVRGVTRLVLAEEKSEEDGGGGAFKVKRQVQSTQQTTSSSDKSPSLGIIHRTPTMEEVIHSSMNKDLDFVQIMEDWKSGDAMKMAILSNSLRVITLTVTVIREEELCNEEEEHNSVGQTTPKPPIPGAYS
eukprot:CAMPEP_0184861130 /NCGR_PEP_ID=MMETSP0580-20130426/5891_1 /TAXON_ID=1118495 /ORGANISM="Dactyliosolen fragilissimus" /LENGTH=335 /DNA_ID=CAMNT_0027358519 /DNA_START=211 /DNA_END=1218 /DNA_ORIENTATION=+